jgi:hypothetical protein
MTNILNSNSEIEGNKQKKNNVYTKNSNRTIILNSSNSITKKQMD